MGFRDHTPPPSIVTQGLTPPPPVLLRKKPDFGLDLYITRALISYTNASHKYPFTCAVCDRHSTYVTFSRLASVHTHLIFVSEAYSSKEGDTRTH